MAFAKSSPHCAHSCKCLCLSHLQQVTECLACPLDVLPMCTMKPDPGVPGPHSTLPLAQISEFSAWYKVADQKKKCKSNKGKKMSVLL